MPSQTPTILLRLLIPTLLALLSPWARAQARQPEPRPRIGLALSGGGGRGYAHVGVIRILEEMNIPIDYIAGTSMGSMVGGLYASGMGADELERTMLALDWLAIFDDQPNRRDRTFHRKEVAQRYLFDFEVGLRGGRIIPPKGLRTGQRLTLALRRNLLPVAHLRDFGDLPIPFSCVATDIENGDWVRLDRGDLALAIRASMSLPGLLAPVDYEGRLLTDGGVFRNLPIDVVRDMGADVVIAVDISAPLLRRDQLKSPMDISNQVVSAPLRKESEKQRTDADILLVPDLEGYGTLGFNRLEAMIAAGRVAAEEAREKLLAYALPTEPAHRTPPGSAEPPPVISSIRIEGTDRVHRRIIESQVRQTVGEALDMDRLGRDLSRIFGLGDFELVDFELVPEQDGLGLVIRVEEKRWGPNYLHANVFLTMDDDQNTDFRPQLNILKTRMNDLGLEWSTDIEIGETHALETSLYQPLDFIGRFYTEAVYRFTRDRGQLFAEGGGVDLTSQTHTAALYAGLNLGVFAEIRAGFLRGTSDLDVSSDGLALDQDTEIGGVSLSFTLDRLDSFTFPRKGGLTALTYYSSRPALGADDAYDILVGEQVLTISRGRHTFLSWAEAAGNLDSDLPDYAMFGIGGFSSFSGYQLGELTGSRYAIYRPTYLYQTGRLSPLLGRATYIGGWLEAGNIWAEDEDPALDDLRFAATLIFGADTLAGPVYLGIGIAEKDRHGIYLSVGRSF